MIDAVFVAGRGSLPDGGSDLQITKIDGLSNLVAGQGITDRLDRKNAGTSAAAKAVVNDGMPANLSNLTGTSTALPGGTPSGNDASGTGNTKDTITALAPTAPCAIRCVPRL